MIMANIRPIYGEHTAAERLTYGPWKIIEIDESIKGKKKYNRGRGVKGKCGVEN